MLNATIQRRVPSLSGAGRFFSGHFSPRLIVQGDWNSAFGKNQNNTDPNYLGSARDDSDDSADQPFAKPVTKQAKEKAFNPLGAESSERFKNPKVRR
ncbi:MAG: hypothetical protein ACAF42_10125 [Limnothrix sp. BL-A-16]|jgi:hypothetical protein